MYQTPSVFFEIKKQMREGFSKMISNLTETEKNTFWCSPVKAP